MRRIQPSAHRTAVFAGLLLALLVVPTVAGFAIARTGVPTAPDELPQRPVGAEQPQTSSGTTTQVISDTPVGQVPSSAEDALTRQQGDSGGLLRLRYEIGPSGDVRLANGGSVPLGDGLEALVTIAPYPPDDFDVDVAYTLLRDGAPVADAAIDTTWDMIFMAHGPFATAMTNRGDGVYVASYDFFMFGPWLVNSTVHVPGREPIDFSISVYVWPTG